MDEINKNFKILESLEQFNKDFYKKLEEKLEKLEQSNKEFYKKFDEKLEHLEQSNKEFYEKFDAKLEQSKKELDEKFKKIDEKLEQLEQSNKEFYERLNNILNNNSQAKSDLISNSINSNKVLEEIKINEEFIKNINNEKCLICLEDYIINDKIIYLPCLHFFHSSCIQKWIEISKNCPLCKNNI